jgi:two-component system OmpR family sensor kinase
LLSKKSLRSEFALKLLPIFAALVFGFSYLVYSMIERGIYDEIEQEMIAQTQALVKQSADSEESIVFSQTKRERQVFYRLEYKTGAERIKLERDITKDFELLARIRSVILIANVISLALIPFIAGLYSYFLARPIRTLTEELAKMDERSLSQIAQAKRAPVELQPLTETLNQLLARIKRHIAYQRELFAGVAHELKTPLAVIRTKNDVALLRIRTPEKYQETLRETNGAIDEINKMTQSVLNIGRAEYAQFDPPETIDICRFLTIKAKDFALLAAEKKRELIVDIEPISLVIETRPTLISHIIQNLFSNALKFTPEGGRILFRSRFEGKRLTIETIDEGGGIADDFDPFAPFAGKGTQKGAGLGLYLAKNAALALGAELTIQNRENGEGAIAALIVEPIKPILID